MDQMGLPMENQVATPENNVKKLPAANHRPKVEKNQKQDMKRPASKRQENIEKKKDMKRPAAKPQKKVDKKKDMKRPARAMKKK